MNSFITRIPALRQSLLALVCILFLGCLAGCGDGSRKMKIADIDAGKNTFSFVDAGSGEKIAYQKLIFDGKEVVDTHCTSGIAAGVVFAVDDQTIVRTPRPSEDKWREGPHGSRYHQVQTREWRTDDFRGRVI